MPEPDSPELLLLIPVYNDWSACAKLLAQIDAVLGDVGLTASVLIANDGSPQPPFPSGIWGERPAAICSGWILNLRRNLGHQRAIAIGLAYAEAHLRPGIVVVMDSDGEDRPEDIPRLVEACRSRGMESIVFAERAKRSESMLFRAFYQVYKLVHVILTGKGVRVGNFSAIPRARLASLVSVSELWNHYAAAAFVSRQPIATIPTSRGRRLDGKSSMSFIRLVTHGLSAISVYSETVGVRLLVAVSVLILFTLAGLAATIGIRFLTDLAIPGWATTVFGVLLIVLFQAIMFLFLLSFIVLGGRNGLTFLPSRDYAHFVGGVHPLPLGPAKE